MSITKTVRNIVVSIILSVIFSFVAYAAINAYLQHKYQVVINEIDVDKELIELLDVSQNEQVQSFTLECLRLFKDNNFSNALMKCDEAINIDPTAKKALFFKSDFVYCSEYEPKIS